MNSSRQAGALFTDSPAEIRKELRMARCTAPSAPSASSCVTRVMQSRITGLPAPCKKKTEQAEKKQVDDG